MAIEEDVFEPEETLKEGETLKEEVITLGKHKKNGAKTPLYEKAEFVRPENFLDERKKIIFEDSFLNELYAEARLNGTVTFEEDEGDKTSTFPYSTELLLGGRFDGKYHFMTQYDFAKDGSGFDNKFTSRFVHLYLERNINENHKIKIGTSRAPIGYEGSISAFNIPFAKRAQISRNFGNAIATGVSLQGSINALDYDIGGYTSTRNTQGFKDGGEFIGRIGFEPFYKKEGSPLEHLKIYAGSDIGHKSENYGVYFAALNYKYKNFLFSAEYAWADGSNGGGSFSLKKRQGAFATIGWDITPKVQLLARYDYFDQNMKKSDSANYEYTAGINYYIIKQRARVGLNYTFSEDKMTGHNKNSVYLLTQFLI